MSKKLGALLVFNVVILYMAVGYLGYDRFVNEAGNQVVQQPIQAEEGVKDNNYQVSNESSTNECPTECVNLISGISNESDSATEKAASEPTSAPTKNVTYIASPKTKSTSYLPIPGSGSTLSTEWVSIDGTDFYLSTVDYPGLNEVYFEAIVKLKNGNGKAFVRLYDVTNSRGVDGSEVSTSNQTSTFVSNGPVNLWAGFNHYKVQVKSLTADTAYFESGKLKMLAEN